MALDELMVERFVEHIDLQIRRVVLGCPDDFLEFLSPGCQAVEVQRGAVSPVRENAVRFPQAGVMRRRLVSLPDFGIPLPFLEITQAEAQQKYPAITISMKLRPRPNSFRTGAPARSAAGDAASRVQRGTT